MKWFVYLFFCFAVSFSWGQEQPDPPQPSILKVLPEDPSMALGIVEAPHLGKWTVVSESTLGQVKKIEWVMDSNSIVIWQGRPGSTYVVTFYPEDENLAFEAIRVRLAGSVPPPGPGPGPNPEPDPPIVSDVEQVAVVIESESVDFQQNLILTGLQKKRWTHQLWILDPDTQNESGQPDPIVVACLDAAKTADVDLPIVAALSEAGSVIDVKPLPDDLPATEQLLSTWNVSPR